MWVQPELECELTRRYEIYTCNWDTISTSESQYFTLDYFLFKSEDDVLLRREERPCGFDRVKTEAVNVTEEYTMMKGVYF